VLQNVGRPILAAAGFLAGFFAVLRNLCRPEIAEFVIGALQDGQHKFRRYQLHAFVVMPNHVHILVTPRSWRADG
jgi:hypothetical protein